MSGKLIKPIAYIYNDYTSKFAIPRQSGISESILSEIIFEDDFKIKETLNGIDDFSHLWLIWGFSEVPNDKWTPTVRPPKLGGNKRVGVFATRSPFRPNGLGLSSVKLVEVKHSQKKGTYLVVSGADMLSGTPVYDIKPYLPYADIHTEAVGGFTDTISPFELDVVVPDDIRNKIPPEKLDTLIKILSQDPRPGYHDDADRIYGFEFADMEVKFKVEDKILTVTDIENLVR